ncbi:MULTISPECIES: alpha/beta hydrolase [Rhizobium]|uniref:Acetyl esterase/lipase n=1 Tax=Rhizobium tropici TaxID=398 RepID=A0A6P1C3T6_RHITR|nr:MULTISPECIES: alpha/beta hydrolase [Rhizobium]AGB73117.1 alpha/beta hydrolase fold-3 catalytic domain-containing protein [Rhizobium tropici CIAT 899]MBB4243620.1 acetyl esterase/lipase [Rhizobium tropici]MBB5595931.1 acetyl esterase/lipase [Rhizobium tropici]MBB6493924.1 acetyl esterase/lipase [Rhizobium tropici]NEV11357.1 alpha/beta hydrolase [Rhizobium tropici]
MIDLTRRELARGAISIALLASAPRSFATEAASPGADTDFMNLVDPELRAAAATVMPLTETLAKMSPSTLVGIRASLDKMNPAPDQSVKITRRTVSGTRNQPDVVVYVINDKPGTRRPAIVHTHGGGYVLGTVAQDLPRLQATSASLDCVIVSVEYRLAPEVTYAGSVEDNYAALKWVFENADVLGVDNGKIAVMGESAGGGHAALLAIKARDRGEFPIAFQLLVYPMLDDRTGSVRQPPSHIGRIIWTPTANRFGWGSFLGVRPGTAAVPRGGVPARTRDLACLPPAYICVGSIDLFVEENITYASRLIDAGVATELSVVPGGFHGFDLGSPDAQIVKTFNNAKLAALRKAFATA